MINDYHPSALHDDDGVSHRGDVLLYGYAEISYVLIEGNKLKKEIICKLISYSFLQK
jgi:hypothetical protein